MRRTLLFAAAALAAFVALANASPAFAQYGAIAYDIGTGRWGVTWNHDAPAGAEVDALRRCASPGCEIRLRTGPGMCGALATTANRLGWGTSVHRNRDRARFAALEACQRYNGGECFVRAWDCNR